ncbi:MAG: DUF2062 domain-containing protein [bacterium]|nr:DUF2062 domain-containing protein [bacterium]
MNNNSFSTDHIWCVIPVFNNKDTVKNVALSCRDYLKNIVVVDDGSTDTNISALFADTGVIVLKHEKNLGKGRAILTALGYIQAQGGRFMITIDADGQHYPQDLEKFIPLLQKDETSIVIGCRKLHGKHVPRKSHFGKKVANFWLRVETGVSIEDCQSGFRSYPVRYLSQMKLTGSHYDFETEVLARAVWAGLYLKMIEVDAWYPEPQSRISHFKPFVDNMRISCMHTRLVGRCLLPLPHRKLVFEAAKKIDLSMLRHPVKLLKMLLKENASSSGLAVSAGVGIFLAVLPLISIHTLVIIYVTARLHLNKAMAITIQNLCIPPFVPAVCIELGYYMRHGRWLTNVSMDVIFKQFPDRLLEWLLGSLIVAPVLAIVIGISVFFTAKTLQNRTDN